MKQNPQKLLALLLAALLLSGCLVGLSGCGPNEPGPSQIGHQTGEGQSGTQNGEQGSQSGEGQSGEQNGEQGSQTGEGQSGKQNGEQGSQTGEGQSGEQNNGQGSQSGEGQSGEQNGEQGSQTGEGQSGTPYVDETPVKDPDLTQEGNALTQSPAAVPVGLVPEASGVLQAVSTYGLIDYSNTKDGYVMVQYTGSTASKLKAQVKGPTTTYTYTLTAGKWAVLPLSDGNGSYQVSVYENITGTKYASVVSAGFSAAMTDEFAPFLRPNQYVDYAAAPNSMAKAAQLTAGITDSLHKVEKVYDFVVQNITYDKALAARVTSGYLPVLDSVLTKKTGICFDYAALMTGMLRSQGVPCKLVVGYAGSAYHAWISVWTDENGWVDGVIYFDGSAWKRMDPTFASSGNQSESIMNYIGDGANYAAKYFY
ncbi:MAG: transglutaminase domain-containing protein [Clostridiales bacterium]|nr:transglutaminase domain-containing protein [Clostridiales bacterium]